MPGQDPLVTLFPYQRRWKDDASRFKIGMFARQTGKTFGTCGEIVDDCIQHEIKKRKARWIILSRGERQAKEAMDEAIKPFCQAFYTIYGGLLRGQAPAFTEEEFRIGEATYKALEVRFPRGSRITALPANPDTARGFSANVFLDEFAFHENSRKIWAALFPVISAGYKLRITSTPNGKGNKFYELMTSEDSMWSRHVVDIYQAVAEGLPRDIDALRAGLADEDLWSQEYELQWLDEASAWLPYDLVTACEHESAGKPEAYTGGPCFVGVDIAVRNHLFVCWVDELVGDVLWTREIVARKGLSFAEQDAILDDIFARYLVARCCMDQTGMGEKPVEDAQRRHGTSRVEGVLFNSATKLLLATLGKEAFEDRRKRIPMGDKALRADLHKLKKVQSPTGAPRFVADDDAGGHADRTWAAFLATYAASSPKEVFAYHPVQTTFNPRFDDDKERRQVRVTGGFRRGLL